MLLWSSQSGDVSLPFLSPTGGFNGNQGSGAQIAQSTATGLTASTTHSLAGALQLMAQINDVTTVANSGDCVKLPVPKAAGAAIVVFNAGADPMSVYPSGALDTIDGGSAGAAVTLTNAKRCIYFPIAIAANGAVTWVSAQLGVASA
jgi:hypothetical protein